MSLKDAVFRELDKNASLTPRQLCAILQKDYKKNGNYIRKIKHLYKCYLKNRQALKCLKFHNTRGWVYAPKRADRSKAVEKGWLQTKAKNRMLLFKCSLGRLEWHTTGRINIRVRKPATWARVVQLLAYGFTWTGLIDDTEFFELWAKTARFKGAHLVYETGVLLPYAQVDMLKESNGVVVKIGDVSHPSALEIEFCYPDWMERSERRQEQMKQLIDDMAKVLELNMKQFENFSSFMNDLVQPKKEMQKGMDGVV